MDYKIGELAREFDITLRTLRHYEARGLINPRRQGTTRYYSEEDRERLRQTLFAKRIGMSLSDIPAYLELRELGQANGCARDELRGLYEGRIRMLKADRDEIDVTIAELEDRLSAI